MQRFFHVYVGFSNCNSASVWREDAGESEVTKHPGKVLCKPLWLHGARNKLFSVSSV